MLLTLYAWVYEKGVIKSMTPFCYFISCSKSSNSGVEKNSPKVIPKPSQIILIVISFGFWLFP